MIDVDSRSGKPIYEQVIDGIKENIIKGMYKPGDRLPSVRELSSYILSNANTVARAYTELERQRVIETIRGKGTFVSVDYKPNADEEQIKKFKGNIKNILIEARYMGISKDTIIDMLNEINNQIERGDK